MFGSGFLLWCCMLSFIPSSLNLRTNSTSDDKNDDYSTEQLDINTTRNYEHEGNLLESENSTEINQDMQRGINSANYNHENHKDNNQTFVESRANLTDADDTKDFASQKIHDNSKQTKGNDDSSSNKFLKTFNTNKQKSKIPYKVCANITCINMCCPFNSRLINGECVTMLVNLAAPLNMYMYINNVLQMKSKKIGQPILLMIHDPCQNGKHLINAKLNPVLQNMFLIDGSLYLPLYNVTVEATSYCLAVDENRIAVNICLESLRKIMNRTLITNNMNSSPVKSNGPSTSRIAAHVVIFLFSRIGIALFSLIMFILYYIVPEFHNIHGLVLRIYSSMIFIKYVFEVASALKKGIEMESFLCTAFAFIRYYCNLACFSWLNVLSFDMWRTFRQFRSSHNNPKQEERKKLIIYSAYGWGVPLMIIIICCIMEFVPDIPEDVIRPNFISGACWFYGTEALWSYYYGLEIIFIINSIFLTILTTRKVARFEKEGQLTNSESRRYDDNKEWFKLTARITKIILVIISIKSYVLIIYALYKEGLFSVWYTVLALDIIQHIYFHMIFVWKERSNIKKQLVKRFCCQN